MNEARQGCVCGFVLMHTAQPVSYVLCRSNSEVITYSIPGYDPKFARLSPGTVLLYLIIQKLFTDRRFMIFDFGGQEWDYKAFLSTGSVSYVKAIWFPITVKHVCLVAAHYVLLQGWRVSSSAGAGCFNIGERLANHFISKF